MIVPILLLAGSTCVAPGPARAADATAQTAVKTGPLSFDDGLLQGLFDKLRKTRDPDQASLIAADIRGQLRQSSSATITMLMDQADKAMVDKKYAAAFDYLDQVIVLDPNYAEGWNHRATLHFLTGNHKKSMADIAETLKREPRHLGALSGMAGILEEHEHKDQAFKVWQRYLEIYPADRDAQKKFSDLADDLAGQKI